MPDPLDLPQDIGSRNEGLDDIAPISHRDIQKDVCLCALNPQFIVDSLQDPLDILMQCEEADATEGCQPGQNLKRHLDTHTTQPTQRKKSCQPSSK